MKTKKESPIGKPISTKRARELAAMRRTFGAGPGRPRLSGPRCACGLFTLHSALQRRHECEEPEPVSHKRKEAQQ